MPNAWLANNKKCPATCYYTDKACTSQVFSEKKRSGRRLFPGGLGNIDRIGDLADLGRRGSIRGMRSGQIFEIKQMQRRSDRQQESGQIGDHIDQSEYNAVQQRSVFQYDE